ncbi:Uncharacterised protein [Bordetella pertussis]|nr:Uncharacterised protein [Bordetella pertussis]
MTPAMARGVLACRGQRAASIMPTPLRHKRNKTLP